MAAYLQRQPWEMELGEAWERGVESDSDGNEEDAQGEAAGEVLLTMLLSLVFGGQVSAKNACTIAWWARNAGAQGISPLALRPSSATGHFQRKIDGCCGVDLKRHTYYQVDAPGHTKYSSSRETHAISMKTCFKVVEDEIAETPDLLSRLDAAIANNTLPLSYRTHDLVKRFPAERLLPLALFIDGVVLNKRSSMIAFFLYNLISGRRHLLCCFRKSELCQRGCRGWCSLWSLFHALRWSLQACADKAWPTTRHDGKRWHPIHDEKRSSKMGSPLSVRSILLFIKGDWAEYAHTFGL